MDQQHQQYMPLEALDDLMRVVLDEFADVFQEP